MHRKWEGTSRSLVVREERCLTRESARGRGRGPLSLKSRKPNPKEVHRAIAATWSNTYAHLMTIRGTFNKYKKQGSKLNEFEADRVFAFDSLVAKGVIRNDQDDAKAIRLRRDNLNAMVKLVEAKVLPVGTSSLISRETIMSTRDAVGAANTMRKERKRSYSGASAAKTGFVPGTLVFDPEELMAATGRIQAENRIKEREVKRRRQEAETKKVAKAAEAVRRADRVKALRAKFPRVSKAKWEGMTRRLARYYTGKVTLEDAEAKVTKCSTEKGRANKKV